MWKISRSSNCVLTHAGRKWMCCWHDIKLGLTKKYTRNNVTKKIWKYIKYNIRYQTKNLMDHNCQVCNQRYISGISMLDFEWSTTVYIFYKFKMLLFLILHKLKMFQMSQIIINWYVANVSFSSATPERKFKLNEYTSLTDIKYEIHHLLPYGDNWRIVKLEYRSPLIDNGEKIEFNNFELKTVVDVRVMWNTYFRFEIKVLLELEARISRSF